MTKERDWRLTFAEEPKVYANHTWQFIKWSQTRDNWDHDHCDFCGVEISDLSGDGILNEGWTDIEEYYWVCDKCFNDFKELYKWKLNK